MYEYELFVNIIKIIVWHILKLCKSRDDKKMFLHFSLSLNVYVCPRFTIYCMSMFVHAPSEATLYETAILSKNNKLYVGTSIEKKYLSYEIA